MFIDSTTSTMMTISEYTGAAQNPCTTIEAYDSKNVVVAACVQFAPGSKRCRIYSCYHEDIWQACYSDGWFEGSVISVIAESFRTKENICKPIRSRCWFYIQ